MGALLSTDQAQHLECMHALHKLNYIELGMYSLLQRSFKNYYWVNFNKIFTFVKFYGYIIYHVYTVKLIFAKYHGIDHPRYLRKYTTRYIQCTTKAI